MTKAKKKFYAVARGFKTGIFSNWTGNDGAQIQVRGFKNALYRGFGTQKEALEWLNAITKPSRAKPSLTDSGRMIIYTDGGAINNPGPGGYGAVLLYNGKRQEISQGYQETTNNRMELLACIKALESLKKNQPVTVYTDSKYVVNGITKGWARKWQKNNWYRNQHDKAENIDLWSKLLELLTFHEVQFQWVKGHAGNKENERCDQLAKKAMTGKNLRPDKNYQKSLTQIPDYNF